MVSIYPGVVASGTTGHLSTSSFYSIATLTGNGSATTLTFSSIPQTYTHLRLHVWSRADGSGSNDNTLIAVVNSDTSTANYSRLTISGDGSAAGSGFNNTGVFYGIK